MTVYQSKIMVNTYALIINNMPWRFPKQYWREADSATQELIVAEWDKVKGKFKPGRKSLITLSTDRCKFTFSPYFMVHEQDIINVTFL